MSITLSRDVAEKAHVALLAAEDFAAAEAVERQLFPPAVYTLQSGEDDMGYPLYLGRGGVFDNGQVVYEGAVSFADAAEATLFSQADRDSFDIAATVALFVSTNRGHTEEERAEFEQLLADAEFVAAPTKDEALDAFDSGNTELDYCESLSFLADRAEALRATLPVQR